MNVQDRVTEMRLVPADQLIANPANWRRHPQAQQRALAAVLDEVGFAGAVIAREDEDGGLVIIDGHARAEMVGEATVPVLVTDLTEAEADVVLATYDPIGAMAQKDHEAFATLAARINTGNETLLGLLGRTKDGETDPDEVPDVPTEPKSKLGEVYDLGPHRVMCGDAGSDIAILLNGGKPAMLLTDPPYGMGLDPNWEDQKGSRGALLHGRPGGKYEAVTGDDEAFDPAPIVDAFRNTKEQFWFGADYYRRGLSEDDRDGSWLVWDKRNEATDAVFGSGFELIWSRQPHKRDLIRQYYTGAFGQDARGRVHPTQKPPGLFAEIMERWSKEGAIVADPFLGSGTTLIACEQTGRVCYGMEIEPRYVDVVRQRYADFVGDPSLAPNG